MCVSLIDVREDKAEGGGGKRRRGGGGGGGGEEEEGGGGGAGCHDAKRKKEREREREREREKLRKERQDALHRDIKSEIFKHVINSLLLSHLNHLGVT